jgi:hypothetical protein
LTSIIDVKFLSLHKRSQRLMADLQLFSVSFVILVIIIVVIIVAWWNSRRDSRQNNHRKAHQERFRVERHRRSRSSSSSDDTVFIPGGLNDLCLVSDDCSNGLACQNQRCVCPRPNAPTVTAIEQGISGIAAD